MGVIAKKCPLLISLSFHPEEIGSKEVQSVFVNICIPHVFAETTPMTLMACENSENDVALG